MPVKSVLNARVPVKIWRDLHDVESQALNQLKNTASLPFVFKHVAAMPDVHLGKGATVGSVVATLDAIVPACVGVDIGCGMQAVKTNLSPAKVRDKAREIRDGIERVVPVGFNGNKAVDDGVLGWYPWKRFPQLILGDRPGLQQRAMSQMGSLGGGNHFIEVCVDREDAVWVMLHSGSRNIGKTLADKHIDAAKGLMKKMFISLPDPDLAYFAEQTPEFDAYFHDLTWCQMYARQNRDVMLGRVMAELASIVNDGVPVERVGYRGTTFDGFVDCHHNYVAREHHFGKNVLVTRKGAVRAREGDYGIIPGSMGTSSFIVEGRGNPESFHSCSHGAGRKMSRSEAKRRFTVDDLKFQTAGVECRKDEAVVDEIPGAYKDIASVMDDQRDLVRIVAELTAILCVKG